MIRVFVFQPPGGSHNLWDLVAVIKGQDDSLLPQNYGQGIMHTKHLVRFKTVRADGIKSRVETGFVLCLCSYYMFANIFLIELFTSLYTAPASEALLSTMWHGQLRMNREGFSFSTLDFLLWSHWHYQQKEQHNSLMVYCSPGSQNPSCWIWLMQYGLCTALPFTCNPICNREPYGQSHQWSRSLLSRGSPEFIPGGQQMTVEYYDLPVWLPLSTMLDKN